MSDASVTRQSIESRLGHLCAFIEMRSADGIFTGSGFLYHDLEVGENDKPGPQWRKVNGSYLVTNRHVIFGLSEDEKAPNSLVINIRALDATTNTYRWHSIPIDNSEIANKVYVHAEPDVDVAVVDLTGRIGDLVNSRPIANTDCISGHPLLTVECSDDVIVVGFPRGYYDEFNHFPIVKKGMIASAWGSDFDGERFFLIDAKLFPGSSGSVVLTKPIEHLMKDGKTFHNPSGKQYAFLGVYSGEPYLGDDDDPEYVDVGIVWYADTVAETISAKTAWTAENAPSTSLGSMVRPMRRKSTQVKGE